MKPVFYTNDPRKTDWYGVSFGRQINWYNSETKETCETSIYELASTRVHSVPTEHMRYFIEKFPKRLFTPKSLNEFL